MELYIRSRNKYILIKVDYIYVEPVSIKKEDGYYIKTKRRIVDYVLGHYKTEKRALEVLDEIQEFLEKHGTSEINIEKNGLPNGIKYYGKIYNMPEE